MNAQERSKLDNLTVKIGVIEERQIQQEKVQTEIKDSQQEFHDKFDRLTLHLIGDKEVGKKGLIEDFSGLKIRVSTLEKVYATVAGLITVVILFGEKLWNFITD